MNGFFRCWYNGISCLFWYLFITGNIIFYGTVAHLIILYNIFPSGTLITTTWILFVSSWLCATVLPMSLVFINMQLKNTLIICLFILICIGVIILTMAQIFLTCNSGEIAQDDTMKEYLISKIDEYANSNYQYPPWLMSVQQTENCCGLNGPSDFGTTLPLIANTEPGSCPLGVETGCFDIITRQTKKYALLIQIISGINVFNTIVSMFVYLIHFFTFKSEPMIILASVLVRVDENNNMEKLDLERVCTASLSRSTLTT